MWFPHTDNIYVHSKYELKDNFFSNNQIPRINTMWGHISLVEAMILLLKNAIINDKNTHFVFLSGHCVPIFDYFHTCDAISQMKKSSIQIFHKRNHFGINKAFENDFIRHSQWCILKRCDVQTILSNSYTHLFNIVKIPDEVYFGTLLNFYNISFLNTVTTFVNWCKKVKKVNGNSPHTYNCITQQLVDTILQNNNNALFIRKIHHNLDLQYIIKYNTLLKKPNIHMINFSI